MHFWTVYVEHLASVGYNVGISLARYNTAKYLGWTDGATWSYLNSGRTWHNGVARHYARGSDSPTHGFRSTVPPLPRLSRVSAVEHLGGRPRAGWGGSGSPFTTRLSASNAFPSLQKRRTGRAAATRTPHGRPETPRSEPGVPIAGKTEGKAVQETLFHSEHIGGQGEKVVAVVRRAQQDVTSMAITKEKKLIVEDGTAPSPPTPTPYLCVVVLHSAALPLNFRSRCYLPRSPRASPITLPLCGDRSFSPFACTSRSPCW